MLTIINQYGVVIPWEIVVANMTWEVASDTSFDSFDGESPQGFFERYCENYRKVYGEECEMNKEFPQL